MRVRTFRRVHLPLGLSVASPNAELNGPCGSLQPPSSTLRSRAPERGIPPRCIGFISFIVRIIISFFFSLPLPPSPFSPCSQDEPSRAAFCSLQAACGNSWQCQHGAISRKLCKNGHLLLGRGRAGYAEDVAGEGGDKLGAAGGDPGSLRNGAGSLR